MRSTKRPAIAIAKGATEGDSANTWARHVRADISASWTRPSRSAARRGLFAGLGLRRELHELGRAVGRQVHDDARAQPDVSGAHVRGALDDLRLRRDRDRFRLPVRGPHLDMVPAD